MKKKAPSPEKKRATQKYAGGGVCRGMGAAKKGGKFTKDG